jgi:hypothetical protein
MLQPLLPALNRPLNIAKPRRPGHLRLRIRLLGRMIIARLVLLRRSIRLRVLARRLRFAGFLCVWGHVGWWRRSFAIVVGFVRGDAGEGAQGEGRQALLVESGAAEGHSGGGGEEVGCWGGHFGRFICLWSLYWEAGKRKVMLLLADNISRDCDVTGFGGRSDVDPACGYARVGERAKLRTFVISSWRT